MLALLKTACKGLGGSAGKDGEQYIDTWRNAIDCRVTEIQQEREQAMRMAELLPILVPEARKRLAEDAATVEMYYLNVAAMRMGCPSILSVGYESAAWLIVAEVLEAIEAYEAGLFIGHNC